MVYVAIRRRSTPHRSAAKRSSSPRSRPQYDAENGLTGRHCFAVCAGVGEPRHWLRTRRQPQDRHPVAKALRPVRPRRTLRSDASRTQTGALRRIRPTPPRYNASREAPSGHPLEHPHPRQALGRLQDGHPARLESARTTAPSPRNFQAQPRQAVRREASRRGRSILESARARAGAQRR